MDSTALGGIAKKTLPVNPAKGRHVVYANFPKIGLGNLLLIWARAKVFSHLNGLPLVTSSWWAVRPGSWLRNEKQKRLYWGYFHESPLWLRIGILWKKARHHVISEPPVVPSELPPYSAIFEFSTPISENEFFGSIKPYREFIRAEIYRLLKPGLARKVATLAAPEIAVHIRRGDFKLGSTITPTSFFTDGIRYVRRIAGRNLKVTVYTDGTRAEMEDVLGLGNVELATNKPDILDILEMSRSRIIFLSQTSSFSYWAAFLSDAIVIKPEGDWYGDIRPPTVNKTRFEGTVNFDPAKLSPGLEKALLMESFER